MSAVLNPQPMKPQYEHSCPRCRFLGNVTRNVGLGLYDDAYVCLSVSGRPTDSAIITRYGSIPSQYRSIDVGTLLANVATPAQATDGCGFWPENSILLHMLHVAIDRGHLPREILNPHQYGLDLVQSFERFAKTRGLQMTLSRPEHRIDRKFLSMRTEDAWLIWKELK